MAKRNDKHLPTNRRGYLVVTGNNEDHANVGKRNNNHWQLIKVKVPRIPSGGWMLGLLRAKLESYQERLTVKDTKS